jgi:hypothetical protein
LAHIQHELFVDEGSRIEAIGVQTTGFSIAYLRFFIFLEMGFFMLGRVGTIGGRQYIKEASEALRNRSGLEVLGAWVALC